SEPPRWQPRTEASRLPVQDGSRVADGRPASQDASAPCLPGGSAGWMPVMTLQLSHDHVALRVVDYDAAVDWYTTKLDFTVDQQWPYDDMKLAYLSNGTVKIEILGASEAEPQVPPTNRSAASASTTSASRSTTSTRPSKSYAAAA